MRITEGWQHPPRDCSLAPFWFWNDRLDEAEIARQMADFQAHGVHAFVLHPRVGLPRDQGWMSDALLGFMRFAVEEAARRGMWVILYDEGMYPSGSASGGVVAADPRYRCRGLAAIDLDATTNGVQIGPGGDPLLPPDQSLVAVVTRRDGHRLAIIDRPIDSVIRGLHYRDDDPLRDPERGDPPEDTPPAADLLNPDAVQSVIRLVYDRFHAEFGAHFGQTIPAIFTDEPMLLGRNREQGIVPGTTDILDHVNRWLGYDFTPHLPALWDLDEPDAAHYRRDYARAIQARLEETYYRPLYEWCSAHGIALTGHPAEADDIGHLRYFHVPGQDIVWRYIEPGARSALEGAQSTQAKCAASAMLHLGRRRNANEYCGAYGHTLTFDEMRWLTHWLVVRGCNLLIPHAFYYSVRGPRIDERPPDVGPNSPWWDSFEPFATWAARLCWVNTDSEPVCEVAILGTNDHLPWAAAKVCYQHQIDFHYLEDRHLWEDAVVEPGGVTVNGHYYSAVILDDEVSAQAGSALDILAASGRLIRYSADMADADLVDALLTRVTVPDVRVDPPAPGLRVRHIIKDRLHYYLLFNEGETPIETWLTLGAVGANHRLYPDGEVRLLSPDAVLGLDAHELAVIVVG